jgi:hypothetical protein
MAATILNLSQFEPIVAQRQKDFPAPGLGTLEIGEKGPGAGAAFLALTHNLSLA